MNSKQFDLFDSSYDGSTEIKAKKELKKKRLQEKQRKQEKPIKKEKKKRLLDNLKKNTLKVSYLKSKNNILIC